MDSNQRFDALKQKYAPVLRLLDGSGISLQKLDVENDKLLIRAVVPSTELRDRILRELESIDGAALDSQPDIRIEAGENVPNTGQGKVQSDLEFSGKPDVRYTGS